MDNPRTTRNEPRSSGLRGSLSIALPALPRTPQGGIDASHLRTGPAEGAGDGAEGLIGVGAEGGDGHQANHDDEGQHDRVFDSCRAVFTLQEIDCELAELTHWSETPFERNEADVYRF